ncbi:hypothetical protein ACJX0J_024496, partial [Zea mays]
GHKKQVKLGKLMQELRQKRRCYGVTGGFLKKPHLTKLWKLDQSGTSGKEELKGTLPAGDCGYIM